MFIQRVGGTENPEPLQCQSPGISCFIQRVGGGVVNFYQSDRGKYGKYGKFGENDRGKYGKVVALVPTVSTVSPPKRQR